MNRKEISVLTALIFTILFSICTQDIKAASDVCRNTLRLHIIANSDSPRDQQIKLEVRDEVLKAEELVFSEADNFAEALENAEDNLCSIEDRLNKYLAAGNTGYTARCSLERFCFDTRQYAGFALPKGEYTALTVRLGKGQGKNWWCVIYPALCSQSCGELALENSSDYIKTDKITARFKIAEIFEDVKKLVSESETPQYKN